MDCGGGFDLADKNEKLAIMQQQLSAPNFWDNPDKAQGMMREFTQLQKQVEQWETLSQRLEDALLFAQMEDQEMGAELQTELRLLQKQIQQLEKKTLFAGKYDTRPAILAIHSGAGGTEAQDWVEMLQRMFLRWAQTNEFKVEILDQSPGDEAGIKSTLLSINGDYAYGWLQSERGVHRLVRLSPFDAANRRHTSFAKVELWPDIVEEIAVEVADKDIRIDRFKASGAGGQHVQKNETAIRITHFPTGIVVSCQNQRSLTQNLETAMKILKMQLFEIEQNKQKAELSKVKGEDVDAGWGNQIRSYILHPYKMVKDHRTNYEVGNPQSVLDGALDAFMEAYLRFQLGENIGGKDAKN